MSIDASAPRTSLQVLTDAVKAELSKLVTLPATWMTVVGTFGVALALATVFASAENERVAGTDPGLEPTTYTQAGFIILGVIAAGAEYVGGQIRTTLTVIPGRIVHRAAAAIALTAIALAAAAVSVLGAVTISLVLGDVTEPDVTKAIGATGYLTAITLLASGIGSLVRRSLPAVAILLGYVFIVGPLLRRFDFSRFLLDAAGHALWAPTATLRSTGLAVAVIVAWTLLALVTAALVHVKRDA